MVRGIVVPETVDYPDSDGLPMAERERIAVLGSTKKCGCDLKSHLVSNSHKES